jgi:hypothetical protein
MTATWPPDITNLTMTMTTTEQKHCHIATTLGRNLNVHEE